MHLNCCLRKLLVSPGKKETVWFEMHWKLVFNIWYTVVCGWSKRYAGPSDSFNHTPPQSASGNDNGTSLNGNNSEYFAVTCVIAHSESQSSNHTPRISTKMPLTISTDQMLITEVGSGLRHDVISWIWDERYFSLAGHLRFSSYPSMFMHMYMYRYVALLGEYVTPAATFTGTCIRFATMQITIPYTRILRVACI